VAGGAATVDSVVSATFPVENGELIVGGMPLTKLAARVGRTPFYVYDRRLLDARMRELRQALPDAVEIHYAVKANPMPALVGYMACLADGLDVASGGEMAVALDAGANPQCISFAGPGKSVDELRQAVAAGISDSQNSRLLLAHRMRPSTRVTVCSM